MVYNRLLKLTGYLVELTRKKKHTVLGRYAVTYDIAVYLLRLKYAIMVYRIPEHLNVY